MYSVVTEQVFVEWFQKHMKGYFSDGALVDLFNCLNYGEDLEFYSVPIAKDWTEKSLGRIYV